MAGITKQVLNLTFWAEETILRGKLETGDHGQALVSGTRLA